MIEETLIHDTSSRLTGQVIHGLSNLPVIDVVAVEEVDVSLIELLVGLLGTVGRPDALAADDASGRHPGHHRRGHACRYDAQHLLVEECLLSSRSKKISSSSIPSVSVCCVNRPGRKTEVDRVDFSRHEMAPSFPARIFKLICYFRHWRLSEKFSLILSQETYIRIYLYNISFLLYRNI